MGWRGNRCDFQDGRYKWYGEGSCALPLKYMRLQRLFTTGGGSRRRFILSEDNWSNAIQPVSSHHIGHARSSWYSDTTISNSRSISDSLGYTKLVRTTSRSVRVVLCIRLLSRNQDGPRNLESAPVGDKHPYTWCCHTTRLFEKRITGAL